MVNVSSNNIKSPNNSMRMAIEATWSNDWSNMIKQTFGWYPDYFCRLAWNLDSTVFTSCEDVEAIAIMSWDRATQLQSGVPSLGTTDKDVVAKTLHGMMEAILMHLPSLAHSTVGDIWIHMQITWKHQMRHLPITSILVWLRCYPQTTVLCRHRLGCASKLIFGVQPCS